MLFRMLFATLVGAALAHAQEDSSLVRLLKGGKIPEERQGAVLDMIAKRGSAADLSYVFERMLEPGGFAPAIRLHACATLADAARLRGVRPQQALETAFSLAKDANNPLDLRTRAVELVGLWKLDSLAQSLEETVVDPQSPPSLQRAAIQALALLSAETAKPRLTELLRDDRPRSLRFAAAAALASVDLPEAAGVAAGLFARSTEDDSLPELFSAFLARSGGAQALADALGAQTIDPETARRGLRAMYLLGRTDQPLVSVLSSAAKIDAEVAPPTEAEIVALVEEVNKNGNPARGESVFRRRDLNCMGCHAIAGAGGNVGPDLGSLGATSPPDYIIRSILLPDESIKEQFQTLVIATSDGQIAHGIVLDRDDQRVILKQADGTTLTVAAANIDEQQTGGSLMPKGLRNLITHGEFLDLVAFLAALGKPGPYALPDRPPLHTWRVFQNLPASLADPLPEGAVLPSPIAAAQPDQWERIYALVGGALPLADAGDISRSQVVFLQTDIDVTAPGTARWSIEPPDGVTVWVDGLQIRLGGDAFEAQLEPGRHTITLRVELGRVDRSLRIRSEPAADPEARWTPVGTR